MPKLPVVSASELIRALKRAGFVEDHQTGSHAALLNPQTGRRTIVPRHGNRDLRIGTLRAIVNDAGISADELRRLLK